jgi:hypothetical protein
MTYAKVDSNHAEIVKAMRGIGAYVINTSSLKNAFDCIVFFRGKVHVVEIKDGTKQPSKQRLTDGEVICKENIEARGCTYNVIKLVEEAFQLLLK